MEYEFEEWFMMSENHFRRFRSGNNGRAAARRTGEAFVFENFQSAVGAPDVFVPPSDEHGLPDSEMFPGAAVSPFRYRQSVGFEGPWCLLLPTGEVFCFFFTVLVEVGSLALLGKGSRDRVFSTDGAVAGCAVDHDDLSISYSRLEDIR